MGSMGSMGSILFDEHDNDDAQSELCDADVETDAAELDHSDNGDRRLSNTNSQGISPTSSIRQTVSVVQAHAATTFTVDAFSYGAIADCSAYFLTHFHSDHYGGLRKSFNHGPIYCSQITANLVHQRLGIAASLPGAVLILFEIPQPDGAPPKRHLHTGDFRAHESHLRHPALAPFVGPSTSRLDTLYLDTTYCDPAYTFPPQQAVVDTVAELVRRVCIGRENIRSVVAGPPSATTTSILTFFRSAVDGAARGLGLAPPQPLPPQPPQPQPPPAVPRSDVLVVVGTYTIGKERVVKGIARALGCKVYCDAAKRRVLLALEDPELRELLTLDPSEAGIHIVSMMHLKKETLAGILARTGRFRSVLAIRPTGWTFSPRASAASVSPDTGHAPPPQPFTASMLKPQYASSRVTILPVPYSEHSSFAELAMFVRGLRVDRVIPTVNVGDAAKRAHMDSCIRQWTLPSPLTQ
ncbi:DNA repair metallo-beta-lactamase-domain-containing protein [Entophlyctis helioformis]|nr:DNA repair metallo-beta-lactamase-domain-containing protein [Entophlyctis helioformis]